MGTFIITIFNNFTIKKSVISYYCCCKNFTPKPTDQIYNNY